MLNWEEEDIRNHFVKGWHSTKTALAANTLFNEIGRLRDRVSRLEIERNRLEYELKSLREFKSSVAPLIELLNTAANGDGDRA